MTHNSLDRFSKNYTLCLEKHSYCVVPQSDYILYLKKHISGGGGGKTGEIAQCPRAHVALGKDPGSVPNIHIMAHNYS